MTLPKRLRLLPSALFLLLFSQGLVIGTETASPTADESIVLTEPALSTDSVIEEPVALADELWMFSTRCLGHPGRCAQPRLQVHRHDGCRWRNATFDEFVAGTDPSQITVIYLHGNRIESHEAPVTGAKFFRALRRGGEARAPLRQVIWSWPSDQVRGPVRDARIKGNRAHAEAYYLAWVLDRLPQSQRISLVGYSFGSRAILGALHLSAGGCLFGHTLCREEHQAIPTQPIRVSIMAAAAHSNWLTPNAPYGLALSRADRMLIYYNTSDPALRYYRVLGSGRAAALGYVGIAGLNCLGDNAQKIRQWNTAPAVGRTHDVNAYFCSEDVMRRVRTYAFCNSIE